MYLEKFPTIEIPEYPVYAMYLRKSREDKEVAEGETLNRHRKQLDELAKRLSIYIDEKYVFTEVVSGETLSARPEMQKLLALMETGLVKGVLVVELARLTRGDKVDQGVIQNTFQYTDTKIITPSGQYDLATDEAANTMLDFNFMYSRYELINTNKRLRNGRIASVKEGKYVSAKSPFGYDMVKLKGEKGFTLEKNEKAQYVEMIFNMMAQGESCVQIRQALFDLGLRTRNNYPLDTGFIHNIVKHPVYKGYVCYSRKKTVKYMNEGVISKKIIDNDDFYIYKGRHEPIVSEELWEEANKNINKRATRKNTKTKLLNEFAGLARCKTCGRALIACKRPCDTSLQYIKCTNTMCHTGYSYKKFKKMVFDEVDKWFEGYKLQCKHNAPVVDTSIYENAISDVHKELSELVTQQDNIDTLLEKGIYTYEKYTERNEKLVHRKSELEARLENLESELEKAFELKNLSSIALPKYEELISMIHEETNVELQNMMLKEILEKIEMKREGDDIEITIYPKLPKL